MQLDIHSAVVRLLGAVHAHAFHHVSRRASGHDERQGGEQPRGLLAELVALPRLGARSGEGAGGRSHTYNHDAIRSSHGPA